MEILSFVKQSQGNIVRFRILVDFILRGFTNTDMYEYVSVKGSSQFAKMKFLPIKSGGLIYCKEHWLNDQVIIVAAQLHCQNGLDDIDSETHIINKIANYEYEAK